MDPAFLVPDEGFDGGGVKDKEGPVVEDDAEGVTIVGLEEIPVVDHISDYESDQSDEAMAVADQQVFVKHLDQISNSNSETSYSGGGSGFQACQPSVDGQR